MGMFSRGKSHLEDDKLRRNLPRHRVAGRCVLIIYICLKNYWMLKGRLPEQAG